MVNNNRSYRSARCAASPARPSGGNTLKKLQAIDLALIETALYLDAYPDNKAAFAYHGKLLEEREKLAAALAKDGKPLTHHTKLSQDTWQWVKAPWPWEFEANM